MCSLPRRFHSWLSLLSICGAILPLTAARGQTGADVTVKSPDGKIVFTLMAGDQMKYSVVWNGKPIIKDAALGISVDGDNLGVKAQADRFPQLQLLDDKFPVRGVHAVGTTRCQSAVMGMTSGEHAKTWNLEVRVFNDGVAYRYNVPGGGKRHVDGESSSWNLPAGTELWYLGGKNRSYEGKFKVAPVGGMEPGAEIMAMATAVLPEGGGYAMMTEANVVNYSDLALMPAPDNSFKAFFHNDQQGWVQESGGPVVSPWRVTLLAADLNVLVNQDVLRSLCPPPSADFSHATYIRPGRSIWHWLTGGAPKLEEQHTWVDGTKQMGFEYYLVDDGWKRWVNGGDSAWDALAELVRYAKTQNVNIWAWVGAGDVHDPKAREEYFEHAKRIGIVGLKIDFPQPANYEWVNWYYETLRDANRLELMIDFHGATKPSGRDRTWPNEMTREAIAGREQGRNPASHDTSLPFTRYVQGNADYTPVLIDPKKLNGCSLAYEVAMGVVYTSPYLCYGDNPKRYLESPAVDVLKNLPSIWDETQVLPCSRIGELAAFARRNQKQWFIGMINGDNAHTETIPLTFLGIGDYRLVELADSPSNNDAFVRSERVVTRSDTLRAPLRKDGGYVAWLQPR